MPACRRGLPRISIGWSGAIFPRPKVLAESSKLRLNFGPGYRIYFGRDGELLVILLTGGTKRRQQEDIVHALTLWQEYRRRKRER